MLEVNRPDRAVRRRRGKSDTIDAENAARTVLSGQTTSVAKSGDGAVEVIRMFKIAKDSAIKVRTQASGTGSTAAATDAPTAPSTPSCSPASVETHAPATTPTAAPQREIHQRDHPLPQTLRRPRTLPDHRSSAQTSNNAAYEGNHMV
ncbi:hypothetical protein [Dactylosporangium sp. NPDC051484]|uniref:hypothetical protein n=1 Tax=Dactylosporangium sp. NPDC051484 TaxID=3154942 RepID=UPI00344DC1CB